MWKTLVLGAALATVSTVAVASDKCNNRDKVLDLLSSKYKEAPVAFGVTNTGGLVEVLSAGDGHTWTIIITSPKGVSCLVAAGEGWRSFEMAKLEGPET